MEKTKNAKQNKAERSTLKYFKGFLVVVLIVISFIGGYFTNYLTKSDTEKTVEWVVGTVTKYGYFLDEETGELKQFTGEEIADKIVSSFLDQYSDYYTPEEYSDVVKTNKGNNFGVGATFLSATNDLKIFRVIGNSPADFAGLKKGDVIVAGARTSSRVDFADREAFVNFISEQSKDTEFTIFYMRDGIEHQAIVKRTVFTSSYVKYYDNTTYGHFVEKDDTAGLKFVTEQSEEMTMLDDKTAYVSFMSFSGQATFEMNKVMEYAKAQGKTKIILDLRDNGGGQMDILCNVASHFVYSDKTEKPIIVYSKDSNNVINHYSASGSKANPDTEKIVVLANGYSASATECLIGAMLHYKFNFDRNSLIIEQGVNGKSTTYGKGIMQRTFINVYTGEALKITTAQIYFPNKTTSIHGVGIHTNPQNVVSPEKVMTRALEILAS